MVEPVRDLKFHQISNLAGSRKRRRPVGRGRGSGSGKTSGRGQKGQGARSGTRQRYHFEGGQTPIMMRSPKLGGFSNFKFRRAFEPVNVGSLQVFADGSTVGEAELADKGLVRGRDYKILGDGDLSKKLIVHAPRFSKSAAAKIEASGGSAIVRAEKPAAAGDSSSDR